MTKLDNNTNNKKSHKSYYESKKQYLKNDEKN